jgi:hypothetical protein
MASVRLKHLDGSPLWKSNEDCLGGLWSWLGLLEKTGRCWLAQSTPSPWSCIRMKLFVSWNDVTMSQPSQGLDFGCDGPLATAGFVTRVGLNDVLQAYWVSFVGEMRKLDRLDSAAFRSP